MARPPIELPRIEDRRIPTSVGGDLAVRVYWPRRIGAHESLPIVLYFHGGGFVLCDIDTHDAIARHLCCHGDAIVINVDYRLAPEHKFPAAVDDAYAALCWAAAHAEELGGGSVPLIAVAGDSAGGNLAAVVSQLAKSNGGPNVALQVLLYPVVELDASVAFASREEFGGGEYFLSTRDMDWFTSMYLEDAKQVQDPRASPLRSRDLSGLPAALVVTAGCDPLRDEGKMYAERLREAGVPVEYRCFEETIHAFVSFAPAIPAGDEALDFVARRLRAALRREMTS
jgi:acetyl esterase